MPRWDERAVLEARHRVRPEHLGHVPIVDERSHLLGHFVNPPDPEERCPIDVVNDGGLWRVHHPPSPVEMQWQAVDTYSVTPAPLKVELFVMHLPFMHMVCRERREVRTFHHEFALRPVREGDLEELWRWPGFHRLGEMRPWGPREVAR